jgi:hypothetical protein
MNQMPVIRQAVLGRILAHGRNADAVAKRDTLQGEWLKQVWHVWANQPFTTI